MTRKCIICGKNFEANTSGKTCSTACRMVKKSIAQKEYRQRVKESKKNGTYKKEIKCAICGKTIEAKVANQKYCSKKCSRESKKKACKKKYEKNFSKPKTLSKGEKIAKSKRVKGQINIDKNSAIARKLGMSYGEYKGAEYIKKNGSILDQPWAQELIKKKQEKKCRI